MQDITTSTPIRSRSVVFGPHRPNGEFGTFAYNVAQFSGPTVRFMIAIHGSESTIGTGRQRAQSVCLAAYWRAVADAQARAN